MTRRRFPTLLFALGIAISGCAAETPFYPDPPKPVAGQPTSLELSATPMTGEKAGQAIVTARILDAYANPVVGASVRFDTTSGTISPSAVASDANGRGSALLLATRGTVKVTASVDPSLVASTLVAIQ